MVLKTSEYYTQLSSTCNGYNWHSTHHVDAGSESNSNNLTGVGSWWLDLALSIEERQYVVALIL